MKTKRSRRIPKGQIVSTVALVVCIAGAASWYQLLYAASTQPAPVLVEIEPNVGVRPYVEEFLKANDAERLLSIIECESNFEHYEEDGTTLKNREGSSAIGIAQIMSSLHPDPKLIKRYNRRKGTNLTVDDLDITTLKGNLGYALILYELRGVRDWECSKLGY